MSRTGNKVITDENYYYWMIPIGFDVTNYVIDGIRDKYVATYYPRSYPNDLAWDVLSISFFYDTQRGVLYITYKLDMGRNSMLVPNDTELYQRIYNNIMTWARRENNIPIFIIGDPNQKPEYSFHEMYDGPDNEQFYLKQDTQFLWNINQGPKNSYYQYFITNRETL